MAFAAELVGVLAVVAPLDIGLVVVPVPRLGDDDVVLVDPGPELHATGNPAHPVFAVGTLESYVITAVVFRHDREQLIAVGHPEVPAPAVFAHTI